MIKNILKIIAVFVIGTIGGIFADQIFWPYFIERPLFYNYRLEQAPIYVTETNEIIVQENTALQEAVEKVEKAVVGIKTKAGKTLEGSGLIITSDGLMITLAELFPQDENPILFVDSKTPSYQILKEDLKENLVLVKIEESNLATVGFADFGSLRFGQRVFLVGTILEDNGLQKIVNEGIIRTYNTESIQTNILEDNNLLGSPLFNIEGNLVGLNIIDSQGKVSALPINKIREFIGF
jgi:S1-C subfamily serine protease